jgi:aldehyde:ferredoxin oxidoreductase
MIDNNDLEMKAMELFKAEKYDEAFALQNQFLEEVLSSKVDHCSCPVACVHHGNCVECVILHRGHADHLPNCMHQMLNKRLEALSELSEHTFKKE